MTTASHRIGSFVSGMFAVFPIVMGSFVVILHPRLGGPAAASVFAHAQVPLVGLGLGFLAVHYLAEPIGSWWAHGGRACGLHRLERLALACAPRASAKRSRLVASHPTLVSVCDLQILFPDDLGPSLRSGLDEGNEFLRRTRHRLVQLFRYEFRLDRGLGQDAIRTSALIFITISRGVPAAPDSPNQVPAV